MDSDWDIDFFRSSDYALRPLLVHVCAYRNEENAGDEDGNPPTNHWAAFLELEGGASVRIDMVPGYGSDGLRGKIMLSSKEYAYTENAIKTLSFPIIGSTTVQTFIDLINSNGREKYNFTHEWEGCRYWIYTVISDFAAAGYIESGSGQATWDAISYFWRFPNGSELREIGQGVFR